MDGDCHLSNNSQKTNVSPSASDHGLPRDIPATSSQFSITQQCAQLSQEKENSFSIVMEFQSQQSLFETQNEGCFRVFQSQIQGGSWASLYFDGTKPQQNNHLHTQNDSGPQPDPQTAKNTSNQHKNQEKMHFFPLLENSPSLYFEQYLNTEPTSREPIRQQDKYKRQNGVTVFQVAVQEENGSIDSPRSKLRRQKSAIDYIFQNFFWSTMHVNTDCFTLNDCKLANASIYEAENCLLYNMNAIDSQLTVIEKCSSLGQEQEDCTLIQMQVEQKSSLIVTTNEQNSKLLLCRKNFDSLANLNFQGTATSLNNHLHIAHDSKPLQDLNIVQISSVIMKTQLRMNFSLHQENLPASTFEEVLHIQPKFVRPVLWQEKKLSPAKVAAQEITCLEENGNESSPRSRLRRLLSCGDQYTAPCAPHGLAFQSATSTSITLQWIAPNDSSYIDGYHIYLSYSSYGLLQLGSSTSTSYTANGLTPITEYCFIVIAYNYHGVSPQSQILYSQTTGTVPSAPTGITLFGAYSTSITFRWNAPYDGGSAISQYLILQCNQWHYTWERCPDNHGWQHIGTSYYTYFTVSGLNSSTEYRFVVFARNVYGDGTRSVEFSFQTSSPTAPNPPTNLTRDGVHTNFTQIAFTWMPPTYNGGSPVTGYRIEWDNGTGFWSVHTASKTDSSLTVTGLVAGTSYLFKVAAINSIGTSAFSNNFRITAAFVPDPPAALTIDYALTNGTQIAFTWTAPVNDGGSPVTGYQILWDQGIGIEVIKNTSYTLLSLTETGLITGTTYNFRLQATNIVGSSAFTQVFPIIAATVPDPPTALTKDEANSNLTQVAFCWTAPVNNGGSDITGYKILWNAGTGAAMQGYTGSYTGGTSLIAATGINAGTLYKFNVASINIIGTSTFSFVEIVAGTPQQPNAPITTYIPATNKIQVSWTAPTTVWSPITSYKIGIICKDLTLYQVTCAESATVILSTKTCSLDISVLQSTPILLLVTDNVVATIQASNVFGDSSFSTQSGTAKIPCQLITRNTFVQSPISYKINTDPVAFGIPTYSLDPSCTLSTINYSLTCLNNSDSTKNFPPPAIISSGGSIQFTDYTAVGLYVCTVKASPSDAPSRTDESFTFSLTANCNQTITAPSPSTSPQNHVLGSVQNINFGLYTLLYSSCQQNIANTTITYHAEPLENGVVPSFVSNLGSNNFDIDTTSLTYGPGLHTLIISATVDPKEFVTPATDSTQTFTVAFNCSIVSMAPTTIQQDITHSLLSNPNEVTTIPLPSFTYLPSYCTATGKPNVVWSAVGLPEYASLTSNQIVIDTNGATASKLGVFSIQLTATAQGDAFINVSSVPAYEIGIKIIYQSCIEATIQPQVFQDPTPFQLTLTPAQPSTILSFMMNADSVGSHLSMPMICGVKTYSTGLSWISVLAPIDPLTQTFQLQITTNDLSLAGTKKIDIIVKFAHANYLASLTQTLSVTLLHPCAITELKPPVIPKITFTIGKAQTFAQFSQITDSVAVQQNIPDFCGERKYELTGNLPFIKLVLPADPWSQNLQLQLYTSEESEKGPHSVNLEVTLVSYSSVKIIVAIPLEIKFNNKPYFQPQLAKTVPIQMTNDSQPWSQNLPQIIDLDGDFVTLKVQLGSPAANFLKINGQASISCDDTKKNGQTNIKAGTYRVTFILDDTKDKVYETLTLLVFEPPYITSLEKVQETSQAASQQASSTNSTAASGVSSGQENTSSNNQLTVESLDSLMNSFAEVKITESMTTEQKQQVLDQLAFDWKKAFAKRNAVKNKQKLEVKSVPVPPNPYIKEATNQGKIYIMFSSDVSIIPNLQLVNNGTIFLDQINLQRELGKKIHQRQLVKERVPVLQVKVIPGIESNSSDLEFIWNVTQQNPKTMDVQLYFYTPLKVSQNSEPDEVEITFNDPSLFTSASGLKMTRTAQILRNKLPRQLPFDGFAAQAQQIIASAQTATKGVVIGNFILNLLMSSSLNMLWSMINTQQLIVLMPCFDLQMPANTQIFFNQINKIASFDIIDLNPLINSALNLNQTKPLNQSFKEIGFKSMYFINNMGSLMIGFVIYIAGILTIVLLQACLRGRPRLKRFFIKLQRIFLYNQFVGMMMESYSLICVSCIIACYNITFKSYGEIVQSVTTFVFMILGFTFPLVVVYTVNKDWNPLRQRWRSKKMIQRRYGAMFEELSLQKGPYVLIWPCYFLLRRLLMAIIVVIFRNFLWMQIFLCSMSIITAIIIIGEQNYFESRFKRSMEFANECLILLMLYNMISFSPFVPDINTRFNMGYFCCIVEAAALSAHLYLIISSNIKSVIFKARLFFAKKQLSKQRDRFLRPRAIGKLLRRERAQRRRKLDWDYGYEDGRQLDHEYEESSEQEIEVENQAQKQVRTRSATKSKSKKCKKNKMISKLEKIVEEENESESERQSEAEHDLENPLVLLKEKKQTLQQQKLAKIYGQNTRVDEPADVSEEDAPIGSVEYQMNRRKKRQGLLPKQKVKAARLAKEQTEAEAQFYQKQTNELPFNQVENFNDQVEKENPNYNKNYDSPQRTKLSKTNKGRREKEKSQLRTRNDSPVKQSQETEQKEQSMIFLKKKQQIKKAKLDREKEDEIILEKIIAQQQKEILRNPPKTGQVQPSHLKEQSFSQLEYFVQKERIRSKDKKEARDVVRKNESHNIKVLEDHQCDEKHQSKKKRKREKNAQEKWEINQKFKQRNTHQNLPDEILILINKFEDEMNKDEIWDELEKLSSRIQTNVSEREVNKFLGLPESSSRKDDKQILKQQRIKAKIGNQNSMEEPAEILEDFYKQKSKQNRKPKVQRQVQSTDASIQIQTVKLQKDFPPEVRLFKQFQQPEDDPQLKKELQLVKNQRSIHINQKILENNIFQEGRQKNT